MGATSARTMLGSVRCRWADVGRNHGPLTSIGTVAVPAGLIPWLIVPVGSFVQVIAFHVRKRLHLVRERTKSVGRVTSKVPTPTKGYRELVEGVMVVVMRQANLLQIVLTLSATSCFASHLNCR